MRIKYKYHIEVYRKDGSVHVCNQKTAGDISPTGSLARGFAALGQLIRSDDRSFVIEIKEKTSKIPTFRISSALPFLE